MRKKLLRLCCVLLCGAIVFMLPIKAETSEEKGLYLLSGSNGYEKIDSATDFAAESLIWSGNSYQSNKAEIVKQVSVGGHNYTGTYKYTYSHPYFSFATDYYGVETGEEFAINADTGELLYFNFMAFDFFESLDEKAISKKSDEELVSIARTTASEYIDVEDYQLNPKVELSAQVSDNKEAVLYRYHFDKKINGIQTSDYVSIDVTSEGNVARFSVGELGWVESRQQELHDFNNINVGTMLQKQLKRNNIEVDRQRFAVSPTGEVVLCVDAVVGDSENEGYLLSYLIKDDTSAFCVTADEIDVIDEYENDVSSPNALNSTYDSVLMAYAESDADGNPIIRNGYFTPVSNYIRQYRSNSVVTRTYASMTKFNMIDWLQSTSLFFIHTHGKQTGFLIAPSVYLQTVDLVGEDLSNIECAVMLTCRTAMVGGGIQTNLIEQMVDCGAETVIGFEDYTQILDCNLFAERFAEMTLRDGRTVAYAVLYMNRDGFAGGICDDAVIEGNGQNIL